MAGLSMVTFDTDQDRTKTLSRSSESEEAPMNYGEIYEDLLAVIEDLAEANQTAPIVVEGERDVRSLRELGVSGKIIALNAGVSVFNLVETLGARHRAAIVLTDWDRRGGQLCKLLRAALEANGVRHDVELRARLTFLCRRDIKDVESLAAYVERLAQRVEAGRIDGKFSKQWYAERKSRAVRERRARRIGGKRERTGSG